MKRVLACLFGTTLFAFLFLAVTLQPAVAQRDQPLHVVHRGIPAGDTCETCHKPIYDQWKAGPHSANGVECTVCHGEPGSKEFAGIPAVSACESCHSDQVAQLKSDSFMKGKTCVSCHQAHTFVEHKKAAVAGE